MNEGLAAERRARDTSRFRDQAGGHQKCSAITPKETRSIEVERVEPLPVPDELEGDAGS
jgi:hypothetical protein